MKDIKNFINESSEENRKFYLCYYDKQNKVLHSKFLDEYDNYSTARKEAEEEAKKNKSIDDAWKAKGWKRLGVKSRRQIRNLSLDIQKLEWY